ncbi:hypothetical protein ISCGN_032811 [Ixodes scapularis]
MRQKPGIIDKTFIIRSFSGAIYPRSTKPSALSATANSRQKPKGEGDRAGRVWPDPDETFLLSPYCSRGARQHVVTRSRADEFSLLTDGSKERTFPEPRAYPINVTAHVTRKTTYELRGGKNLDLFHFLK